MSRTEILSNDDYEVPVFYESVVVNEKKVRETSDPTRIEAKTIAHAFRALSNHFDEFHTNPRPDSVRCNCPLDGWHIEKKGAAFTPKSIVRLGELLVADPKSLSKGRIWPVGAQNIVALANEIQPITV